MSSFKIAAIPADGIGPEVISAGLDVLTALGKVIGDLLSHFIFGSDCVIVGWLFSCRSAK